MHITKAVIFSFNFIFLLLIQGCPSANSPTIPNLAIRIDPNAQSKSVPNGGNAPNSAPPDASPGAPNYTTATLNSGFNKTQVQSQVCNPYPINKDFTLLVQKIGFYSSIFVDLRADFMGNEDVLNTSAIFKYNNDPGPYNLVSVYQPFTEIGQALCSDTFQKYYTLGHTLNQGVGYPIAATVTGSILVPPNLSATSPAPDSLMPAIDYELIFSYAGPNYQDIATKCSSVLNATKPNGVAYIPSVEETNVCNELIGAPAQGITTSFQYLNGGRSPLTVSAKVDEFLAKKSLYVWRPQAPQGYKCLGDIATNTSDKPTIRKSSMGSGMAGTGNQLSWTSMNWQAAQQAISTAIQSLPAGQQQQFLDMYDSPAWCVKQTNLSPGKLKLVTQDDTKKVRFYSIVPADSTGLENQNLFYTLSTTPVNGQTPNFPTLESQANTDVWVINKNTALIMDDVNYKAN